MNTGTTHNDPIGIGHPCRPAAAAREIAEAAVRRKSLFMSGQERSECGPHQTRPTGLVIVLSPDAVFARELERHVHRTGYAVRVAATASEICTLTDPASLSLVLVDHRVQDWEMLRTDPSLRHVLLMAVVPLGSLYAEDRCISDLERGMDGVHHLQDRHQLLVAKVRAYLRRGGCNDACRGVYRVGAVELDRDAHEVRIAGRQVKLPSKPFAILTVLMREPSKVFSRNELIDRIWGQDCSVGEHTLDVHIHAIRKELNREPNRLCDLITIKRVGFKLKPVSSVGAIRARRDRPMFTSIPGSYPRSPRTPRLTSRIGGMTSLDSLSDPPPKSPTNICVTSACG